MPRHRIRGCRSTAVGVVVATAVLAMIMTPQAPAVQASSPPGQPADQPVDQLGCADQVFDPSAVASTTLATTAAEVAARIDADLHVRIEGSLDGDIDGRERLLEQACSSWLGTDGLRAPNLLVVMVSPSERSTSIYYGEKYYATLSATDSQIEEFVMNPRFKEEAVEGGLIDGLNAIEVAIGGGGVPQAQQPAYDPTAFTYTPSHASSDDEGNGLPIAGIIGLIVLLVLVTAFSTWAKANGWASTSNSSGYRRGWSSSSSRSFSSSSSHHSSSSSHHSGGGGSSSHW
jgi:hypothetical protein